jgi:pyruvate/2-oxoglutarate dehydrogenase complex dihydrolipoamide acyltransferase (E2) component
VATEIRMPSLGVGMTEGKLVEWFVVDGATVEAGAPIYSLETDKTVQDIECPVSGTLKIVAAAGDTYDVDTLVGYIE